MAKTIFSADSQITPSWFNTIQNLRFVGDPQNDGEYPLIEPDDIQPGVFDNRYLGVAGGAVAAKKTLAVSPEVLGGNVATLGDLNLALQTTVTNFSSDGTLSLVQSGNSVQVKENTDTVVLELGGGYVLVKGRSATPGTVGVFLATVSFPVSFLDTPSLLQANLNFPGRVNHMLEVNTSSFSCVCVRSSTAKITDEVRYLAIGRVS